MTTITTRSKDEAECIATELAEFDCRISQASRSWVVDVSADAELGSVLRALDDCLTANGIPFVSVSIDGRTYVMEGAAA